LVQSLEQFYKIKIFGISEINSLSEVLETSRNQYFILIAHSNSNGIRINDDIISWKLFSSFLTAFPEKTFIIPTCYSFNIYQSENIVLSNLVAPFMTQTDYRISIDTTVMTLGILTKKLDLINQALDALLIDAMYIEQPQDTLIIHESGNQVFEPGTGYKGRVNVYDKMAAENSFITFASVKAGAMLILLYLIKGAISTGTILTFLLTLFDWIANWLAFIGFLVSYNIPIYVKVYDDGTYMDYDHYYDYITDDISLNYYLWFHSLTFFRFYSDTYSNPDAGWIQRKYWNVGMEIELLSVIQVIINDLPLGLFSIKSIIWHCFASGVQNVVPISTGGGGGGKPGTVSPD